MDPISDPMEVVLVPYGSTDLHLTEIPYLKQKSIVAILVLLFEKTQQKRKIKMQLQKERLKDTYIYIN